MRWHHWAYGFWFALGGAFLALAITGAEFPDFWNSVCK